MKKVVSAAVLAATLSAPALAAEPGGYVDVDLGRAKFSNANFGGPLYNINLPNPGTFQIGGGYHFSHNLGVEGGLVLNGNSSVYGTTFTEHFRSSAIYGAAVGLLPLSPQFDLFGKLGLAAVKMQDVYNGNYSTGAEVNIMYGLGAQFNINRNWGVRAQYMNFGTTHINLYAGQPAVGLSTVTIGGIYTF